jgi:hypothetical protein
LCQPRVIVKKIVEKQMECRLGGKPEVLGENLPQCYFCPSQNPTWPDPGLNPGCRGGKLATNRLSYSAAQLFTYLYAFFLPVFLLFRSLLHSFSSPLYTVKHFMVCILLCIYLNNIYQLVSLHNCFWIKHIKH